MRRLLRMAILACWPFAAAVSPAAEPPADPLAGPFEAYFIEAFPEADPADLRTGIQLALRTLGYFHGWPDGAAGPAYADAVSAFQVAQGRRAPGTPTLADAADLWTAMAAFAPGVLTVAQRTIAARDGAIVATGTWVFRGLSGVPPLNVATIECLADEAHCAERGVDVEPSGPGGSGALRQRAYAWRIVERAPGRVVAETRQGRCVAAMLVIDVDAQTAVRTQRNSGEPDCAAAIPGVWTFDLANGPEIAAARAAEAHGARLGALSPAMRAVFERLRTTRAWPGLVDFLHLGP